MTTKRIESPGRDRRVGLLSILLGASLLSTASQGQVFELGVLNTWLKGGNGGLAYGGSLIAKETFWRYADITGRVGYQKSDCHNVTCVPLEATAALKYPLFGDRLVPYAGMGGGYYIWTGGKVDLQNSWSWYPLGGITYYLGKQRKWSLFIEGRYEYMEAKILAGGPPGKTMADFDRWGGGLGVAYRF
jgi:hypothetical protein